MARRAKPSQRRIPASATARRFDGGGVKLEILLAQPADAARIADQIVNALLVSKRRGRPSRKVAK